MRPAHIIITIVLVVVPLFALSIWWAMRNRKIYQRLLQDITEKGLSIDPMATFASAGHTWLSRDEDGKTLMFIPENLKNSGRYNVKDVVLLHCRDLREFSVVVNDRIFTSHELKDTDIGATVSMDHSVFARTEDVKTGATPLKRFASYRGEAAGSGKEGPGGAGLLKRLELHLLDNNGNQYRLLLASKNKVALAIKSRLVEWVIFLNQVLAENKGALSQ